MAIGQRADKLVVRQAGECQQRVSWLAVGKMRWWARYQTAKYGGLTGFPADEAGGLVYQRASRRAAGALLGWPPGGAAGRA